MVFTLEHPVFSICEFVAVVGPDFTPPPNPDDRIPEDSNAAEEISSFPRKIYGAKVEDVFPASWINEPVVRDLPMFCLLNGVGEEMHPRDPEFYTLVTTDGFKVESYISVLLCWVPTKVTRRQMKHASALNMVVPSPVGTPPIPVPGVDRRADIGGSPIIDLVSENQQSSPSNLAELQAAIHHHDRQVFLQSRSESQLINSSGSSDSSNSPRESDQIAGVQTVYLPQCIAISSRLPCFSVFRDMLREIHEEFIQETGDAESPSCFAAALARYLEESAQNPSQKTPGLLFSNMPRLYTYLDYIFKNVPVPSVGKIEVAFSSPNLSNQLVLRFPAIDALPFIDVPLRALFSCLDENNILRVLGLALLERNIVFVSKRISLLTSCAITIRALMYPLQWEHTFIPVLPAQLVDFLDAPTPFMVGIHPDLVSNVCDGVIVDLDHNHVWNTDFESADSSTELPRSDREKLLHKLATIMRPHLDEFDLLVPPSSPTKSVDVDNCVIQKAFLETLNGILGNFDEFSDLQNSPEPYLASQPEERRSYLASLVKSLSFLQLRDRLRTFDPSVTLFFEFHDLRSRATLGLNIDTFFKLKRKESCNIEFRFTVDPPTAEKEEGNNNNNDEGQEANSLDVSPTATVGAKQEDLVAKITALITSTHEDNAPLLSRFLMMRGIVFAKLNQPLKALQDLSVAKDFESRLVSLEWFSELLHKLSPSELPYAVNMNTHIRSLIESLRTRSPNQRNEWVLISGSELGLDLDFRVFEQALSIKTDAVPHSPHFSRGAFTKLLVDSKLTNSDTANRVFDKLIARNSPSSADGPFIEMNTVRRLYDNILKLMEVHQRYHQMLDLDQNDRVVAVSPLCTWSAQGSFGRLYMRLEGLCFGLTSPIQISRYSHIVDVERFEKMLENGGRIKGVNITLQQSGSPSPQASCSTTPVPGSEFLQSPVVDNLLSGIPPSQLNEGCSHSPMPATTVTINDVITHQFTFDDRSDAFLEVLSEMVASFRKSAGKPSRTELVDFSRHLLLLQSLSSITSDMEGVRRSARIHDNSKVIILDKRRSVRSLDASLLSRTIFNEGPISETSTSSSLLSGSDTTSPSSVSQPLVISSSTATATTNSLISFSPIAPSAMPALQSRRPSQGNMIWTRLRTVFSSQDGETNESQLVQQLLQQPSILDPVPLSVELLKRIVRIYRKGFNNNTCIGAGLKKQLNNRLKEMQRVPEYTQFRRRVQDLRFINFASFFNHSPRSGLERESNLDSLSPNVSDIIIFFVNIFNCLVMHCLLEQGYPFLSPTKRKLFFENTSYTIGDVDLTLRDIQSCILCNGQQLSKSVANPLLRQLCCVKDPRIHFVLALTTHSSPPLRILLREGENGNTLSISQQLDAAASEFLLKEVSLSADNRVLHVPKMFSWFANDFGGRNDKIIEFIASKLPEEVPLRSDLENIRNRHLRVKLTIKRHGWVFCPRLPLPHQ